MNKRIILSLVLCLGLIGCKGYKADTAIIGTATTREAEIGKPGETSVVTNSGRVITGKSYHWVDRILPMELLNKPIEGLCPDHNKLLKEGRCGDCEQCQACPYYGGHNRHCPYDYINSKDSREGLKKDKDYHKWIKKWEELGWNWEKGKWKETITITPVNNESDLIEIKRTISQ